MTNFSEDTEEFPKLAPDPKANDPNCRRHILTVGLSPSVWFHVRRACALAFDRETGDVDEIDAAHWLALNMSIEVFGPCPLAHLREGGKTGGDVLRECGIIAWGFVDDPNEEPE